jgi:hypothetical protein
VSEIIFSPEDSDLAARKWRFDRWGYARRSINRKPLNPETVFAHHDVCIRAFGRRPDWSKREVCDHINRNKLDNRRENLRIVSVAENNKNSTRSPWGNRRKNNHFTPHQCGKYQAQYRLSGRSVYVGLFDTPEAARAATLKSKNEAIAAMERMAA